MDTTDTTVHNLWVNFDGYCWVQTGYLLHISPYPGNFLTTVISLIYEGMKFETC